MQDEDLKRNGDAAEDAPAPPPDAAAAPGLDDASTRTAGEVTSTDIAPTDEAEEIRRERDQFRALAQRVQADYVNYRKRVEVEREEFRRQANRDLLLKLLSVIDGLDLALQDEVTRDVDGKWVEGVRAVRRGLDGVLGPAGVEMFGAIGERFDPRLHEAIARVPAAGFEPDTVLKVHRAGYRMHGDVIRPALVEIAAAPPDDNGDA